MTTNNSRLPSTLSKKILAHNFSEAQELMSQGVNLTNGLISTAIWRDNFEAFEFLFNHGKSGEVSDHDLYSAYMNSSSNKFKEFFIAQKNNNPNLQKLFSKSEYHVETFVEHANSKLNSISIANITPKSFAYDLELEMQDVIDIKNGINTIIKKLDEFSEFRKHLNPISIESELMLEEIKEKAVKYKEMYNDYLADRLHLREQLKPLYEQREELNNHIAKTIEKHVEPTNLKKNKLKS